MLPLSSFVGRARETSEIKERIRAFRLTTLTGPGGSGKTRLAIQVATDLIDTFPDGVWWVELAPLADPALVPQAIAKVLGVRELPNQSLHETLAAFLGENQLLLVLDNCEHVLPACAQLAQSLLTACPELKILTTSREPLRISGEAIFRVPPLTLPNPQRLSLADILLQYEAIRLFVKRAQAVKSDFVLTEQNAPSVAQICQRLDGIPLALELAAARIQTLSANEIAGRLDDRFQLLTDGSVTVLPRHQTLQAAVDWSYDLLTEPEQLLLNRLAVFAGGWTLEAAEAVCSHEPLARSDIFTLLTHLVDKSLVLTQERDDTMRYSFLETIREYASAKLIQSGENHALKNRHLEFCLDYAKRAEPYLISSARAATTVRVPDSAVVPDRGNTRTASVARLKVEYDNLRTALAWSLESGDRVNCEKGLSLVAALGQFWWYSGYINEGCMWCERTLAAAPAPTIARALVLTHLGNLAVTRGEAARARQVLQEAIALWQKLENPLGLGTALAFLALATSFLNERELAVSSSEQGVAILREVGSPWHLAIAISIRAQVAAWIEANFAMAQRYLEECIQIVQKSGDDWELGYTLRGLGQIASFQGDLKTARALYEQSMNLLQAVGERVFANMSRSGVADMARFEGDYASAISTYLRVLQEWRSLGNRGAMARCLECIAFSLLEQAETRPEQERLSCLINAVQLLGAAHSLRETNHSSMQMIEQAEYERYLGQLRERLPQIDFTIAWNTGRALSSDQALALVLHRTDSPMQS